MSTHFYFDCICLCLPPCFCIYFCPHPFVLLVCASVLTLLVVCICFWPHFFFWSYMCFCPHLFLVCAYVPTFFWYVLMSPPFFGMCLCPHLSGCLHLLLFPPFWLFAYASDPTVLFVHIFASVSTLLFVQMCFCYNPFLFCLLYVLLFAAFWLCFCLPPFSLVLGSIICEQSECLLCKTWVKILSFKKSHVTKLPFTLNYINNLMHFCTGLLHH